MTVDQEYAHAIAQYLQDKGHRVDVWDDGYVLRYTIDRNGQINVIGARCGMSRDLGPRPRLTAVIDLADPQSLDQIAEFFRSNA
jgi:hypothetical protein